MINFLKKTFTVGVVVTTIVWSLGLAAFPLTAQAATIAAGDLITAPGTSAVYYYDGAKRWVFPNEKTYFTWYPDFSQVKEITDTELGDIPIGGNVVYQAGRLLVKITTDPKVYFVGEDGMLHHVTSEAIASGLWGPDWASMVRDVPDGFFVNYQVGAALDDPENELPVGSYFVSGGDLYYINDNGAVWLTFNRSQFPVEPNPMAEQYVASQVFPMDLSNNEMPMDGTASTFGDLSSGIPNPAGGLGVPPPMGDLDIIFNGPGSQDFLYGQGSTPLGTLSFNNPGGEMLQGYHGCLGGTLPWDAMGNFWMVVDGVDVFNLPQDASSSTRCFQVFGNYPLPPNATGQLYGSSTGSFSGPGEIDLSGSVTVDGTTYDLPGAVVDVQSSTTPAQGFTIANGATPPVANVGGTNQNMFNFQTTFNKAGTLNEIWVYESGTGSAQNLSNCTLLAQSNTYQGQVVGNYLHFAPGFAGNEGSTYNWQGYCDVDSDESATNAFMFSLRNSAQVLTMDSFFGVPYAVTNNFTGVTATLQQSEILVSSNIVTPADVVAGTNDQNGGEFIFDKVGTTLNTVHVRLHRSTGNDVDTADAETVANDIRNIRLELVRNGSVVATLDSFDISNMANIAGFNTGLTRTITTNIHLEEGDLLRVKFNTQNSANLNGNTYFFAILFDNTSFTDNQGDALLNYIPTTELAGQNLRLTTAGITIALSGGVPASTHSHVAGDQRIPILEVILDPGEAANLQLTGLSVLLGFDNDKDGTPGNCTDENAVSCTTVLSTLWGENSLTGAVLFPAKSAAGTATWAGLNLGVPDPIYATFYVKSLVGGPASANPDWAWLEVTSGTAQDINGSPVNVVGNPGFNINDDNGNSTPPVLIDIYDAGTVMWKLSSNTAQQGLRKMGDTYTGELVMETKTTRETGYWNDLQMNIPAGNPDELISMALNCPNNSSPIPGVLDPVNNRVNWTGLSSDPLSPKYCPVPSPDVWHPYAFDVTYNTNAGGADVSATGVPLQLMLQDATGLEFLFNSGSSVTNMGTGPLVSNNLWVIRDGVVVEQQSLPSTVLTTGNNEVSKLRFIADPVQLSTVRWTLAGTLAGSTIGDDDAGCANGGANGICTYLNTYRGSSCVVLDTGGTTVPATITYANTITGAYVNAVFTTLQSLTDKVYRLRCSFTGVQTNDSISTKLEDNNSGYELSTVAGVTAMSSLIWTGDPDAVAGTTAWHNEDFVPGTEITQTLFK